MREETSTKLSSQDKVGQRGCLALRGWALMAEAAGIRRKKKPCTLWGAQGFWFPSFPPGNLGQDADCPV